MATARRRSVNKKTPVKYRSPHHASEDRFLQATNVYLMFNMPFLYISKFGISDTKTARARNVSETTPGAVGYVWQVNLPFGKALETFVHGFYALQRRPFDKGSGRTEWFLNINIIVGGLALYCNFAYDLQITWYYLVGLVWSPVVWLDGLFWLAFFWAVSNLAKAGIIAALGWALYLYTQTYPN